MELKIFLQAKACQYVQIYGNSALWDWCLPPLQPSYKAKWVLLILNLCYLAAAQFQIIFAHKFCLKLDSVPHRTWHLMLVNGLFLNQSRTWTSWSNILRMEYADSYSWNVNVPLRIKADDRMIQSEGVESLSEPELRAACRDRGMLGLLSVQEMRGQVCLRKPLVLLVWECAASKQILQSRHWVGRCLFQNLSPWEIPERRSRGVMCCIKY